MSGSNTFFDNRFYSSQTFTASGTFNVPVGVNMVFVEMYGGGAGGSAVVSGSVIANGGGEGERIHAHIPVTSGGSVTITIGGGTVGASTTGSTTIHAVDGGNTVFGSFKSPGGVGGGGGGRDSFRATGGTSDANGQGGDAGHGNGGNGGSTPTDGGTGAGGGGMTNAAGTATGGDGGDGICIVHWKLT